MIAANTQFALGRLLLEGDNGGWVNLLVLVVMGVLWALGGVVKAKKRKEAEAARQQEQGLGRKPPPGPVPVSRAAQRGPAVQPLQQRGVEQAGQGVQRRPQPARPVARPKGVLESFLAQIKAEIQGAAAIETAPEPKPAPSPEVRVEPSTPKPKSKLAFTARRAAAPDERLAKILPGFESPDDLRKGILYYEILGKPVSLRGPGEHLIGP